jgi:hypothetical protein
MMRPRMMPARLAFWLLERFDHTLDHDALVGDLVESYTTGRTMRWLWRQVLHAAILHAVEQVSNHRLLAIQAALGIPALLVIWLAPRASLSQVLTLWALCYCACGFIAVLLTVTTFRPPQHGRS